MKAEDACLNDSSDWKEVEKGGEILPNVSISILPEAFVVETIHLCDLFGLVVSTENGDS